MSKPTVLLADDHTIVTEGLKSLLSRDFDVVGSVADGRKMIDAALELQPEVIVADISMPLLNGIEAVRKLRETGCEAKVVFLTMHPDLSYATRALDAGGSGYVLKHAASEELIEAIRAALRGETFLSAAIRQPAVEELLDETRRRARTTLELTGRQREVLQLLAEGKSAKEIGAILDISPRTVETHKYNMMDQLGVKTTAQLVQYAIRHGLVSGAGLPHP